MARARRLGFVALGVVLTVMLLAGSPCALALDPTLDVNQYAHRAWRIREGFTKGIINAMAQTPDGYLWLGTEFGLLRFDGVRTVPWQPPGNQHLPSDRIAGLLASHDGTLWIGTTKGLASWKDGKLTQYADLAGQDVFKLLEDHEGTIWAGGYSFSTGRLCAIQNGAIYCSGADGSLGAGVWDLYEDSKGNLWVSVNDGLWRWKPGLAEFHAMPGQRDDIRGFVESDDGKLLFRSDKGIQQIVDGKIAPYSLPGNVSVSGHPSAMLRDRDGGLWIATSSQGVVHVHHGKTDVFAVSDGLSGDDVFRFFEDREGNVWVATLDGLDCFRALAVTTISQKQGLLGAIPISVLADKDGSIWLGTIGGLNKWNHGQISIYGKDGKFNGDFPNSMFQARDGRVWISTIRGFGYLQNGGFVPISGVPGGYMHSIAEDNSGTLWIANQQAGLFQLFREGKVQQVPWGGMGRKDFAGILAADPVRGGLWLGFYTGGIAYFADGAVRESYSTADGLGEGWVQDVRVDPDGTLWASTQGGLSRLKNGRVSTLSSKNGLPCNAVHWSFEDDNHSFWLHMDCGLVRIARSELDKWVAAADRGESAKLAIHSMVFDSSDGVRSQSIGGGFVPHVTKSSDGKLWFVSYAGFGVVDPDHLALNKLPPPVRIEQITADHKTYDAAPDSNEQVRLPPRIRDLQIDYTALSLVAPEKVLFRYKLEGWDRGWQDAGTRRQAFYSNLPPRNYTFRVKACNNSGVWNEAGTSLNFSVAPAYYQTLWFRSLCVLAFLVVLAALYQLRLQQVARQFNMRMEERVNERTRVARDLHDTLLQSFQGVLLKFHAVTYLLPDRPDEAQKNLEAVIEQARGAITEGRDAVYGLRSSTIGTSDLAQTISTLGEELAGSQTDQNPPGFRVQVEGTPRDLAPLLRDEVYRVAGEALRNAFKHAHARRIEVQLRYDRRQLRLSVRDDGKGIDPKLLGSDGRAGHYGLPGMHERARLVGGKLSVWTEIDSGTEVELTIPAAVAYAKSPAARRPMFSRRGA